MVWVFFPGKPVYFLKYANPGLAVVGIRMGWIIHLDQGAWIWSLCVCCHNAAFMSFVSAAELHFPCCTLVCMQRPQLETKGRWSCKGYLRMLCVLTFMGDGVMEKSFSSSLPLPFSICRTISKPHWSGRSGDELPLAVPHLMGSKSCFSHWLALSPKTLITGVMRLFWNKSH